MSHPVSQGSMGYAIPAVLVWQIKKDIICVVGDGSL